MEKKGKKRKVEKEKKKKNRLPKPPKAKLPAYTHILKSRFFGRTFVIIGIVLLLSAMAAIVLNVVLGGGVKGILLVTAGLIAYLVYIILLVGLPIRRMSPVNAIFLIIMVAALALVAAGLAALFDSPTVLGTLVASGVLSMMTGVAGSAGTEEHLTYFWVVKRVTGVVLVATGHLFIMKRVFFAVNPWICLSAAVVIVMILSYNVLWTMSGFLVELSENEYVAAATSALTFLEYPLMIIDRAMGAGRMVKEFQDK